MFLLLHFLFGISLIVSSTPFLPSNVANYSKENDKVLHFVSLNFHSYQNKRMCVLIVEDLMS